MSDDRRTNLVVALTLFAAATYAVLVAASCCAPNRPPSWVCQLRERVVECGKSQTPAALALGVSLVKALQGEGWEGRVQQLVDTGGDLAVCVLGSLPKLPATVRVPAGVVTAQDVARGRAAAFLRARGLSVR